MKPYHDPAEQIETEDIPPKESYKGPITRSRIKTLEQNDSGALSSFFGEQCHTHNFLQVPIAELAERWTELPQVSDESRSFFRVHTGYFSNIPKCIKAEFIASWGCSQSSVVSSSQLASIANSRCSSLAGVGVTKNTFPLVARLRFYMNVVTLKCLGSPPVDCDRPNAHPGRR
ncbi:hypothetical protein TNCV_1868841 [Trichonephila clavipes]|nr:hypothetical protein TNCV_1868841 [Trichonephila clavipes]